MRNNKGQFLGEKKEDIICLFCKEIFRGYNQSGGRKRKFCSPLCFYNARLGTSLPMTDETRRKKS